MYRYTRAEVVVRWWCRLLLFVEQDENDSPLYVPLFTQSVGRLMHTLLSLLFSSPSSLLLYWLSSSLCLASSKTVVTNLPSVSHRHIQPKGSLFLKKKKKIRKIEKKWVCGYCFVFLEPWKWYRNHNRLLPNWGGGICCFLGKMIKSKTMHHAPPPPPPPSVFSRDFHVKTKLMNVTLRCGCNEEAQGFAFFSSWRGVGFLNNSNNNNF